MNRAQENAKTLASLTGASEIEAAALLDIDVLVTIDESDVRAARLADHVSAMLSRTIKTVRREGTDGISAELVIGSAAAKTGRSLRLTIDRDNITISPTATHVPVWGDAPSLLLLFAACYAVGRILAFVLGDQLRVSTPPVNQPFIVPNRDLLGDDTAWLNEPIQLEGTYLAGAGAIGNGFVYALSLIAVTGDLVIVDPDTVSDGNLNRCICFVESDVNAPKATRLADYLSSRLPGLLVTGQVMTLQELAKRQESTAWLNRVIVGVDSRRVRRHIQGEIPREVFDASTTGVEEVVFHHHAQPTETACLSCIYHENQNELSREAHIAEALGVKQADIRQHHVSAAAAERIRVNYPTISREELIGQAYDSLFKALCSEGQLNTPHGKQLLAPFAFVSVLAGAVLVTELARRLGRVSAAESFNYARLSPWNPPVEAQRVLRPRFAECEFCSNPTLLQVARELWGYA